MYSTFIFNLDGTMIDAETIGLCAIQSRLKEKGNEISLEELRFSLRIPGLTMLETLNIADIPTTLESWLETDQPLIKDIPLFAGIMEVITQLPRVGIVTCHTAQEMNDSYDLLNIDNHFQMIICGSDTINGQTDPSLLVQGLNELESGTNEAIYIGDSICDMKYAQSAGIAFGLATWATSTISGFENADYIFNTPYDILALNNKSKCQI